MSAATHKRGFLGAKRKLLWAMAGIAVMVILVLKFVDGFLAVSQPVGEGILAVEAWIPAKPLEESAKVFQSGRYRYLVLVGGPMGDAGQESAGSASFAELAAGRLEKIGFDANKIVKLSDTDEKLGHTLGGATAVARWLESSGTHVCCVDVFTVGVHARRSWALFRYALGDRYRVGIIAGPQVTYDPNRWLVSRRGIWIVSRNLAGFLYVKLWILLRGKATSG